MKPHQLSWSSSCHIRSLVPSIQAGHPSKHTYIIKPNVNNQIITYPKISKYNSRKMSLIAYENPKHNNIKEHIWKYSQVFVQNETLRTLESTHNRVRMLKHSRYRQNISPLPLYTSHQSRNKISNAYKYIRSRSKEITLTWRQLAVELTFEISSRDLVFEGYLSTIEK